jgi:ethanolamine utilization protein EutA
MSPPTRKPKETPFFSGHIRTLDRELEITLTSVGVDIGSSTSHLVFSKIVMERRDTVYVVTEREVLRESEIVLTPYTDAMTIDADALGQFIEEQYRQANISPDDIDTGALILTGIAVRRANARAIGELFAGQAGKFVSVSAGDGLETTLVAYGSGAVALSNRENLTVMNVDIGGGTTKIAICRDGEIIDRTVIDVGARIICFDDAARVSRIEEAGRRFADEAGVSLTVGETLSEDVKTGIVECMSNRLFQAMGAMPMDAETPSFLRMDPLTDSIKPDALTFSGGVSEYLYGRESNDYGDLGPMLALAARQRADEWACTIRQPVEGIRATVVGASQYTIQLSGNTIFVAPQDTLPLRNIPAITPKLELDTEDLNYDEIVEAIRDALNRLDLQDGRQPVALCFQWAGSATYRRLDTFCTAIIHGMAPVLKNEFPLILVTDSDVGGLVGLHCHEECGLKNRLVSIDGISLKEFEFIDIGEFLESSGAVPVAIKSLVFPETAAVGEKVS